MIKLYVVGNDRTDEYSRELSAAIAASRSAGAEVEVLDAAVLNTDAILARSPDVVISAGLSDSLSVLLKDQGIVSIVFGTLSEYSSVADIVIDHKAHDTMLGYRTKDFSLVHNPGFNFNETADLIRKLPWDTDFWGIGVGSIKSKHLTAAIYGKAEAFARQNDIGFLEFLCSSNDQESIVMAESLGFHLVDIRVDMDVKGTYMAMDPLPDGLTFGIAEERHIPELRVISKDLYKISRYYFDGGFDKKRVSDFYNMWVEKAVYGTFDHICYCIFRDDVPVGFATFRYLKPGKAMFGLGAFSDKYQGQGLGRKLFRHVVNINAEKGITYVTSATQGRNYMTQRMHQSIDFKTASVELWFHKWLK